MKPTLVIVHTSESPYFPGIGDVFSFKDFERYAFMAACGTHDHEDTDISVFFDNGTEYEVSLCLAPNCQFGFQDHVGKILNTPQPEDVASAVAFLSEIQFISH